MNKTEWKIEDFKVVADNQQASVEVKRVNQLNGLIENLVNDNESFNLEEGKTFQQIVNSLNLLIIDSNKFIQRQNDIRNLVIQESYAHTLSMEQNDIERQKITQAAQEAQEKIEQIKTQIKEHITQRTGLVKDLNIQVLKSLKFDKLSELNDMFVWFIRVIYKESTTNYYWPNLRDQIFGKDHGVDFLERLEQTRAQEMTSEEATISEILLKKQKSLLNHDALNQQQLPQFTILFKIVENYATVKNLSVQMKSLLDHDEQLRQTALDKEIEGERMKGQKGALENRIKEFDASQNQLKDIHSMLLEKQQVYNDLIKKNKEALVRLETKLQTINPALAANFQIQDSQVIDDVVVENQEYDAAAVATAVDQKEIVVQSGRENQTQIGVPTKEVSQANLSTSEKENIQIKTTNSPKKLRAVPVEIVTPVIPPQQTGGCNACNIF